LSGGGPARGGAGVQDGLLAGRVGRPHGLDGSFYVTGSRPRLLQQGAVLLVRGRSMAVTRRAGTDARPIVRLEGIADREQAQALRGEPLAVPQGAAPALAQDEWWSHELEGCEVCDGKLRIGTVARVLEYPSCEALEVRREDGGELLVPMVRDAVRHVSVRERRIEVDMDFIEGGRGGD
jgi:16S rRNA processing protein RimM